jgi:hypothetical protein
MSIAENTLPSAAGRNATTSYVTAGLLIWFGLAFATVQSGAFADAPDQPPLALIASVAVPIFLFLGAYWLSTDFRAFVLTRNLRFVTMLQAWRVVGFAFVALYLYGVLPGFFAIPAGLGDFAVGAAAPFVVAALVTRPDYATSRGFLLFNLMGLLDFVVAIGTGLGMRAQVAADAAGPSMAPLAELPLGMIPGFVVPLFILLHLTALLQRWHLLRSAA